MVIKILTELKHVMLIWENIVAFLDLLINFLRYKKQKKHICFKILFMAVHKNIFKDDVVSIAISLTVQTLPYI